MVAFTKMDNLSKQGILVALLSLAQFIYMAFRGILDVSGHRNYETDRYRRTPVSYYDEDEYQMEPKPDCLEVRYRRRDLGDDGPISIAVGLVGIALSVALIFGTVKKSKNYVAAYFIAKILGLMAYVGVFIYSLFDRYPNMDFSDVLLALAYQFLTLCITILLYLQLRREECENKQAETNLEANHESTAVTSQPKFNPYFLEVPEKKEEESVL